MIPRALWLTTLTFIFASCAPTPPAAADPNPTPVPASAAGVSLTNAQKQRIGQKIWQNESGGTIKGLTHWNVGEEFPSMGIGHFIWYPRGFQGRWTESFPELIRYAQARGLRDIPAVAQLPDCPWNSKAEFDREFNEPRLSGLRNWLSRTVPLQTDFIMAKSRAALPEILAASPASERARIQANYDKVSTTPNGTYALIDYVNFKGSGTNAKERYKGQGWGLLWVLREMRDVPAGQSAATEFSNAAKRCLDRRIANSPPARGEKRWREGWHNRCNGYGRPL